MPQTQTTDDASASRAERLLAELVDINSPTTDPSGVNRVQGVIARELVELGFEVRFIENPDRNVSSGELLVAELRGARDEFITLVSHADTVLTTEAAGGFSLDPQHPNRGRGSGVIDNKGGLVVAVEGLRRFVRARRGLVDYSLRLVSSPNEEGGSLGFHAHFARFSLDSILVLGFEPALDNGSIVQARRGNRWYDIHVEGREAHAGRCKGEQINAAHELALKIASIIAFAAPDRGLAVNIGHIEGGRDKYNVVCGEARAKLDTRFANFPDRDRLHADIVRVLETPILFANDGTPAHTTYSIVDDCPPFARSRTSARVIEAHVKTVSEIEGRAIAAEDAGGAGDVNYMSREDLVVLDGFGPVGGRMHTPEEFIELSSLVTRATALERLFENATTLLSSAAPRFETADAKP